MRYAAYGSNLHPLRLADRISSARFVTAGFLPNWSLCFHKRSKDRSAKCNILAGGDGVHVAIYEISGADKLTLDKIEGVGVGYANISLRIPGIGQCLSYTAEESHIDDSLRPYDWYKALVLIGARFHGFPDDYVNSIEAIQAVRDPDEARRAKAWTTVEMATTGF